jgi:hypothetical protein
MATHMSTDLVQALERNAALTAELANERARQIHSCHPDCARDGCVNARLRLDLARVLEERDALKVDAARYRWMRAAWLEGVEDDTDPVAQQVLGTVQNEAEVDAVIDAQIAAGNWPLRP